MFRRFHLATIVLGRFESMLHHHAGRGCHHSLRCGEGAPFRRGAPQPARQPDHDPEHHVHRISLVWGHPDGAGRLTLLPNAAVLLVVLDAVRVCRRPNGRLLGAAALALIVRRRPPRDLGTGIVLDGLCVRRFAGPRRCGLPVTRRCSARQSSYHGGSCLRVMATSRPTLVGPLLEVRPGTAILERWAVNGVSRRLQGCVRAHKWCS